MGYLETIKWDTIKKDLQKGFEQGMVAVKKGAIAAKKKAEELSDEGKKQYKIFTLKTKLHEGISDLGARVYTLMGTRAKNPALDAKVRDIVSQLKKTESQIASLERETGAIAKKTAGTAARKKTATR
jgi:hypothetical protein